MRDQRSFTELSLALASEMAEQRKRRWLWLAWWVAAAAGVVGVFMVSNAGPVKMPVLLLWLAGILNIAGLVELVLYSRGPHAQLGRCVTASAISAFVFVTAMASLFSRRYWLVWELASAIALVVLCVIVFQQWRDLRDATRKATAEIDALLKDLYRSE